MSEVKLPDPMTYCKARMIDASLYGRRLESEMFGKIINELARYSALKAAVEAERMLQKMADDGVANDEIADAVDVSLEAARAEVDRLVAESKGVKLRCKHKEEV